MARFKRKFGRRGRVFMRSSRRSSRGSSGMSPMKVLLPAMAYGAARSYISTMAEPITSKIPLGGYADEALFGVAGYFLAKKGNGMVKNIGLAMLTVEAAAVGHQLASGMTGGTQNSGSW